MSDKNYWEEFYSEKKGTLKPSPFASYIMSEYGLQGNLLELGCGNGRDSLFFAESGLNVIGIDQCQNTVKSLNGLRKPNTKFESDDFTQLGDKGLLDNIYSRFTLHSVTKDQCSETLKWAYKSLNKGGNLLVEVRSIHDELYGQGIAVEPDAFVTDHYRRFLRIEEFVAELEEIGFNINYSEEAKGFAVYKDEDPSVIRVVAVKNN